MGIRVCTTRNGGDDSIVVGETGQLEIRGISEMAWRERASRATTTCNVPWGNIMGEVVLSYNLERLLKDFPQLDGFVIGG